MLEIVITASRGQRGKLPLFLFGFAWIAATAAALLRFARVTGTASFFSFTGVAATAAFFSFARIAATAGLASRQLDAGIGLCRGHWQNVCCANAG